MVALDVWTMKELGLFKAASGEILADGGSIGQVTPRVEDCASWELG